MSYSIAEFEDVPECIQLKNDRDILIKTIEKKTLPKV